jgi:hypothetical protein
MMTTCWNCGARLSGPTCQMCGAVQAPQAGQPSGPAGQPVVSQASMSVRPTSGGQPGYPPGEQPGMGGYPQNGPYQQPGMPGSGVYQQPAYGMSQPYQTPGAQPYVPGGQPQGALPGQMMGPQPFAPAMRPAPTSQPSFMAALPLALVGGLVGGVIGALIWAFLLQITSYNIYFVYAIGLGFLVGLGVAFGGRGRFHLALAVLAGALGLFSVFLALYFRLGLAVSDVLGQGLNPFALPLGDYFDVLKLYLHDNPINYLYFVLTPFVAIGSCYRFTAGNGSARRRRF